MGHYLYTSLLVASQSERDHYRFLLKQTAARVIRSCDGEIEREVHAILGPVGVDERLSRQVADCLRQVELDSHGLDASGTGASSTEEDGGLRWSKDVGLTPFLLKFGEGMGESSRAFYLLIFVYLNMNVLSQRRCLQNDCISRHLRLGWDT